MPLKYVKKRVPGLLGGKIVVTAKAYASGPFCRGAPSSGDVACAGAACGLALRHLLGDQLLLRELALSTGKHQWVSLALIFQANQQIQAVYRDGDASPKCFPMLRMCFPRWGEGA